MKKTVKKAQAHPAITKHHGTVKRALKVQALESYSGRRDPVYVQGSGLYVVSIFGHSGNLVGGWHKVEAATVEIDGGDEVPGAAEAAGGVFHPLNL